MGKTKTVADSKKAIDERHEEQIENDDTNVLELNETAHTLDAILKELKIMNMHLSILTDTIICTHEVN